MENKLLNKEAPQFKGINQNGKIVNLTDFKGKKVVLYFYPKDMTPGCTSQACNLNDNLSDLMKHNIEILGISADDTARHTKFIQKYSLAFDLIADEDHSISEQYGVWQLKKFMGREFMGIVRTTFLINEDGVIEHVINKPKVKEHAQEILATWNLI